MPEQHKGFDELDPKGTSPEAQHLAPYHTPETAQIQQDRKAEQPDNTEKIADLKKQIHDLEHPGKPSVDPPAFDQATERTIQGALQTDEGKQSAAHKVAGNDTDGPPDSIPIPAIPNLPEDPHDPTIEDTRNNQSPDPNLSLTPDRADQNVGETTPAGVSDQQPQ